MPSGPIIPMTVYVSPRIAERVRGLAAAADRSVAAEIRQAIQQHLTKSESPAGKPSPRDNSGVGIADHVVRSE